MDISHLYSCFNIWWMSPGKWLPWFPSVSPGRRGRYNGTWACYTLCLILIINELFYISIAFFWWSSVDYFLSPPPHNPLARTRRWERAVEGFFCCISFAGLRPLPNRYFVAAFLLIELWTRCARQWRRNDDTKAVRQSAAGPVEFRLPDRISIDRTVFFTEKRKLKKISSSECFFSELATVVAVSTRFNWIVTSFYRAL